MSDFDDPGIYRSILEALKTGVCVVDRQKKIVFWNDGAERITGYLRHEIMGHTCEQNLLKHCNGESCELCGEQCPLTAALRDAKSVEVTGFVHHKNGHRTLVQVWSNPVRDARGSIIGAVESFDGRHVVPVPDRRQNDLEHHGVLDHVTGIANKTMLEARLREALSIFLELNIPFGILCVQLVHLDQFGFRYGQEATNTMLRVIAKMMENSVRPTDFVGRWAEDRFLVILSNCKLWAMEKIRERVRKMVTSSGIEWWGEELRIPANVAETTAQPGDTFELLSERVAQTFNQIATPSRASAASAGGQDTAGS